MAKSDNILTGVIVLEAIILIGLLLNQNKCVVGEEKSSSAGGFLFPAIVSRSS